MALSKKIRKYLDSLSDEELYYELALRFGQYIPVWKEVSKEEYDQAAEEYSLGHSIRKSCFIEGALWMKEKLERNDTKT